MVIYNGDFIVCFKKDLCAVYKLLDMDKYAFTGQQSNFQIGHHLFTIGYHLFLV